MVIGWTRVIQRDESYMRTNGRNCAESTIGWSVTLVRNSKSNEARSYNSTFSAKNENDASRIAPIKFANSACSSFKRDRSSFSSIESTYPETGNAWSGERNPAEITPFEFDKQRAISVVMQRSLARWNMPDAIWARVTRPSQRRRLNYLEFMSATTHGNMLKE